MHRFPLACLLVSVTILMGLAVVVSTGQAESNASKPWRAIANLRYFQNDQVDFSSDVFRRGGLFLVVPSGGDRLFVLDKKTFDVRVLGRETVVVTDGVPALGEDVLGGAEKLTSYEKKDRGRWLAWQIDGTNMAVGPKPELIGEVTLDQLIAEKQTYREKADAYEPQTEAVTSIRESGTDLDFVVGFGTWCPTCADWTPRFIKTIEEAGYDDTSLLFVSVDPEYTKPAASLERYKIESVPAFIVMRDGEEVGRIDLADLDRDPDTPIELRLARLLGKKDS
jgi:hypothetical protein